MRKHGKDYGYPRVYFLNGVTEISRTQAHEYIGMLFVLVVTMVADNGHPIWKMVFPEGEENIQFQNWLNLFEMLLVFDAWTHGSEFWQRPHGDQKISVGERNALSGIRKMLHQVKTVAPRNEKQGWKIPKFHEILHLPWAIRQWGSPMNFDAGHCESHHKTNCKKPANTAQKRRMYYEKQVGLRYVEMLVVERANELINGSKQNACDQNDDIANVDEVNGVQENVKRASYYVVSKNENNVIFVEWLKNNAPGTKESSANGKLSIDYVHPGLSKWLIENLSQNYNDGMVVCLTEYSRNDTLFRAHPCYKNESPWYDWVNIPFEMANGELVKFPCKILCFVMVEDDLKVVFITCSTCDSVKYSVLTDRWKLHHHANGSLIIYCHDVSCLDEPCFVADSEKHV